MKTQLVTAPTGDPIDLDDIKLHLRIEIGETAEDTLLRGLRTAAMNRAEQLTGLKLLTQTWYYYIDQWPAGDSIEMPFSPFAGLNSTSTGIVYWDTDRSTSLPDSTTYRQDTVSKPGRVVLDYNDAWPSDSLHNVNPIRLEGNYGYGSDSSSIPENIRLAMKLMIGHWYENRENSISAVGLAIQEIPDGVKALLYPYKVWRF